MQDFINITLLALLGSVIALFGGIAFLYIKPWSNVLERYAVSFAAGVLITISLVALLPESVAMIGSDAFIFVLGAFIAAFVFENLFFTLHHHDHQHHSVESGPVALVLAGDTIHNFIDGIAIAASYFVSPGLGLITAFSTFLHEVPHEIGDFGILLKAGWSKKRVIIINILSALTTVLGAYFVFFVQPNERAIGAFLAIAAGLFLYLGASDFLPHINDKEAKPKRFVVSTLVGVGVMLTVFSLIPHSHEEGEDGEHSEVEFIDEDIETGESGDTDGYL